MTDIELLELAAKAAGYLNWTPTTVGLHIETGSSRGSTGFYWDPLTSDGDALRLAVKLGLSVEILSWGTVVSNGLIDTFERAEMNEDHNNPCAATRRAIVRAAAEIGKQKSQNITDAAWCIANDQYGV